MKCRRSAGRPWTWEELAATTLSRQFPLIRGRGEAAVVELVRRVGPIQAQAARAPYVGIAARLPGATYDAISAAYESYEIVRASNLRGTVHTCVREQHPLLDAVTRRTMANGWRNHLALTLTTPADVQAGIEAFAAGQWRTPEELREHLYEWLARHEGDDSATRARTSGVGRSFARLHGGLIRRPLRGAEWDRQTAPGYRLARDLLDEPRSPWLDDEDAALTDLTRVHLAAFGPATRRDVAWWSGAGLQQVDAALDRFSDELLVRSGPGGLDYYELAGRRPPTPDVGVRLLPEFDALVLGYAPNGRVRFLDPAHLRYVYAKQNGMFSPSVLVDGRIVACWTLAREGESARIEVDVFPGERMVSEGEVADAAVALGAALRCSMDALVVRRID